MYICALCACVCVCVYISEYIQRKIHIYIYIHYIYIYIEKVERGEEKLILKRNGISVNIGRKRS